MPATSTSAPVRATLGAVSPMFVVSDVEPAVAFYRDRLGFAVTFLGPQPEPFFAIVARDDGRKLLRATVSGAADDAPRVGRRAADSLLEQGAATVAPLRPVA